MYGTRPMMSLGCVLLGCGMTLLGVHLLYLQPDLKMTKKTLPAYMLIFSSLLLVLIGFFWVVYQSIKSKMFQRETPEQQIEIYTIYSNARRFGVATASGVTSQAPARQGLALTPRFGVASASGVNPA
ncbi:unnamed protein product [Pleuronectes platessa]|uniref:Transmembrane protein n=1 Tax=Pleuronectes platessa TaxID=8262 RepID=A0A9N7TR23_PLEPL|nr:unnamed protein product [Pleuronectes platessa]